MGTSDHMLRYGIRNPLGQNPNIARGPNDDGGVPTPNVRPRKLRPAEAVTATVH